MTWNDWANWSCPSLRLYPIPSYGLLSLTDNSSKMIIAIAVAPQYHASAYLPPALAVADPNKTIRPTRIISLDLSRLIAAILR
jgi:hypothetical protein